MVPHILLVKMGVPGAQLLANAGDYDAWFRAALGPERVRLTSIDAYRNTTMPPLAGFDAVISSGSPLSVTDRAAWMTPTGEYLLNVAERGKPVLGVCFGHQLVAQTLGAKVEKNPSGREIGTVEIRLTSEGQADPLFAGLGESCRVQATHVDAVLKVPRGATLLAENTFGVQALRIGKKMWTTQFHPELDAARMRALIESRREVLADEKVLESARASVSEAPAGRAMLGHFLDAIG